MKEDWRTGKRLGDSLLLNLQANGGTSAWKKGKLKISMNFNLIQ